MSTLSLASLVLADRMSRQRRDALCQRRLRSLAIDLTLVLGLVLIGQIAKADPLDPNAFPTIFSVLEPSSTVTINTSGSSPTLSINGGPTFVGQVHAQGPGEPSLAVFSFGSVNIPQGITVNVSGTRPLAVLSQSTLRMNGEINLNRNGGYQGGQAAWSGNSYSATNGLGPGGGAAPPTSFGSAQLQSYRVSGGGGGFGGAGQAAYSNNQTAFPGPSGGSASGGLLSVLEGGSGGGGGHYSNNSSARGGNGGGAIELGAVGVVTMAGAIYADGENAPYLSSGAGSGGGVLIHGADLDLDFNQSLGRVEADGGSGTNQSYASAGGGGRIAVRIPTFTAGTLDFSNFRADRGSHNNNSNYQNSVPENGEVLLDVGLTTIPEGQTLALNNGEMTSGVVLRTAEYDIQSGAQLNLAGENPALADLDLAAGAILEITGADQSIEALAGGGEVRVGSGTNLVLGEGGASSNFSGTVVDRDDLSGIPPELGITGGGLMKVGAGTVVLSGDNAYTGGTTVEAGRLVVDTDALPGNSDVVADGTLEFNQGSFGSFGRNVSGEGLLEKSGAGSLVLTGEYSQSQGTVVSDGTLVLAGATLRNGAVTLAPGARLENDGGTIAASDLQNSGTLIGGARVTGAFNSFVGSETRLSSSDSLVVEGTIGHSNAGRIEVLGGELEFDGQLVNESSTGVIYARNGLLRFDGGLRNDGSMALSFGTSDILGEIENRAGGEIVVSGLSQASFVDAVSNNGRIHTGTGSTAVFFGPVSGAGQFTGTGQVLLEGGFSPGNSPGTVTFGGDLLLGDLSTLVIELAGRSPGVEYDQILVAGSFTAGGIFDLQLLDGFSPLAGDSFTIFEASVFGGAFSSLALPSLSSGLSWNTDSLLVTGELFVVPEPGSAILIGLGLSVLARRRGRSEPPAS